MVKSAPGSTAAVPLLPLNLIQPAPSPVSCGVTVIFTFHVDVIVIAVPAFTKFCGLAIVPSTAVAGVNVPTVAVAIVLVVIIGN